MDAGAVVDCAVWRRRQPRHSRRGHGLAHLLHGDAGVIAAAPDLYDALDDLSAYFEDGADINLLPQILAQARAALARARGETL